MGDKIETCVSPKHTTSVAAAHWEIKGMKETVFAKTKSDGKYTPKVLKDECAFAAKSWRSTVLQFTSNKYIRLPIVDSAPSKISNRNAEYGIDMGPVCFY